jgi:hypothetical protein
MPNQTSRQQRHQSILPTLPVRNWDGSCLPPRLPCPAVAPQFPKGVRPRIAIAEFLSRPFRFWCMSLWR